MFNESRIARIIQSVLAFVVLLFIGYYFYKNINDFEILFTIQKKDVLVLSFFYILSVYFSATQNALLIRSLGVPLSDLESFGLSSISALVALVVPQGLTITKAVYLKQKYSLAYSKSPAWFLGLLVVFLFVGSCIMALTNTIATLQGVKVPEILWVITVCGGASGLLFFFDFPKKMTGRLGKIGALIDNFADGWKELRSNRTYLIKACFWQTAIFIATGLYVTVAYNSIGIGINPLLGISLSIFIFFSTLVTIVPGNLGVQEAVYGYFSYMSGLTFVQGVVASTLMRVIGLFITLILAPISWYFLFYRQKIKI